MKFMINRDVVAVSGSSNAFSFDHNGSFKMGRNYDVVSSAVDFSGFAAVDIAVGQGYVINDCSTSVGQTTEAVIGMSDGNFVVVTKTDECWYGQHDIDVEIDAIFNGGSFNVDDIDDEAGEKYSAEAAAILKQMGY